MRKAVHLLAPICLFFGLTAALASAEPPGGKSAPIEVTLSEYAIAMPHALPAGPTTFRVRNEGKKSHSFKIAGPGLDEILSKPVRPHEMEDLQVTLQPGEYKVYCPIGSHEARGMTLKLVVTAASRPPTAGAGRP